MIWIFQHNWTTAARRELLAMRCPCELSGDYPAGDLSREIHVRGEQRGAAM
jgi:hypothetical protein